MTRSLCPIRHADRGLDDTPLTRFDTGGSMVQLLKVSSLVQRNKVVSKRKGTIAAAVGVGAGVAAIAGAPVVLTVVGLAGAGYLAWDWFSYRVKNGMRF
jgi:hypothetical protein